MKYLKIYIWTILKYGVKVEDSNETFKNKWTILKHGANVEY
jgi:hypothetical protein